MENYIPYSLQYAPIVFTDCIESRTLHILQTLSKNSLQEGIPNMILYGSSGSGKYTKIYIMLKHFVHSICDITILRMKAIDIETYSFTQLPTSKNKQKVISVITSPVHIEIDIGQPYIQKALIPFLDWYTKNKNIPYKIHKYIILRNIELLDIYTQKALRKYMECTTTRFLCTTSSLLSIQKPLRSRLLSLFIPSPSIEETKNIIEKICSIKNIKITPSKMTKIVEMSRKGTTGYIDLSRMFLVLEGTIYNLNNSNNSNNSIKTIYTPKKDEIIQEICKYVIKGNIPEIRKSLYILYEKYNYACKEFLSNSLFYILYKKHYVEGLLEIATKWNHILQKYSDIDVLIHGEAYLYKLCELYNT